MYVLRAQENKTHTFTPLCSMSLWRLLNALCQRSLQCRLMKQFTSSAKNHFLFLQSTETDCCDTCAYVLAQARLCLTSFLVTELENKSAFKCIACDCVSCRCVCILKINCIFATSFQRLPCLCRTTKQVCNTTPLLNLQDTELGQH